MSAIIENTGIQGKWVFYRVSGYSKKVYVAPSSSIRVEDITHESQINFTPIDASIRHQIERGKNFRNATPAMLNVVITDFCGGLIYNGDFECAGADFPGCARQSANYPYMSYITTGQYEGTRSLSVRAEILGPPPLTSYTQVYQEFDGLITGETYQVSAAIKTPENGLAEYGRVTLSSNTLSNQIINSAMDTWQVITATFTATTTTDRITLRAPVSPPLDFIAYFDSISVTKIS